APLPSPRCLLQRPWQRGVMRVPIGNHLQVPRGSPRIVIHFDIRCPPLTRQTGMNGMISQTADHGVEPIAVSSRLSLARRDADNMFVVVDAQRPTEVFVPPAESDHRIVGGPVSKRVVARVPDIHAATVPDEGLE